MRIHEWARRWKPADVQKSLKIGCRLEHRLPLTPSVCLKDRGTSLHAVMCSRSHVHHFNVLHPASFLPPRFLPPFRFSSTPSLMNMMAISCHVDCSNRGLCNHETGVCACFDGYHGQVNTRKEIIPCCTSQLTRSLRSTC